MRNGHYVIDIRARPPSKEYATYFTPSHVKFFGDRLGMKTLPKSFLNESLPEFFAEADAAGIDRMICIHRMVPAAGGSPECSIPNDHVAGLVGAYPDKLAGVAGIDVGGTLGDPLAEARRSIEKLGMHGIHISPTRSALATHADDRRLYPIYELCVELKVPVVIMTGPFAGPSIEDTHPKYIQKVAADFPQLPIVVGHACWPYTNELLGVAYRHENVFLSPDAYLFMPGSEVLIDAAKGFLQDQFLYGSAYPVRELDVCLDLFLNLNFTADVYRKTLGENAARVFGLAI